MQPTISQTISCRNKKRARTYTTIQVLHFWGVLLRRVCFVFPFLSNFVIILALLGNSSSVFLRKNRIIMSSLLQNPNTNFGSSSSSSRRSGSGGCKAVFGSIVHSLSFGMYQRPSFYLCPLPLSHPYPSFFLNTRKKTHHLPTNHLIYRGT